MLPSEDDLSTENFNLKDQVRIVWEFFRKDKGSTKVPEFVTKINENVDLLNEISYFGKKVNVEEGIDLIKAKAKILFKQKETSEKIPIILTY